MAGALPNLTPLHIVNNVNIVLVPTTTLKSILQKNITSDNKKSLFKPYDFNKQLSFTMSR